MVKRDKRFCWGKFLIMVLTLGVTACHSNGVVKPDMSFLKQLDKNKKDTFLLPEPVCVLDYKMEDGGKEDLKDSSVFHNDAKAVGHPYGETFRRVDRKSGGTSLKIGNCPSSKSSLDFAFIPRSESLRPEQFLIQFDIRPEKSDQPRTVNIFEAVVDRFNYAGERKAPKCRQYYPLTAKLTKNNRLRLTLVLRGADGKLKGRSFTVKQKLPGGKFSRVKWAFWSGAVGVWLDGELVQRWAVPGSIAYDHPNYYPDRVVYRLSSGAFAGSLDNFQVFDLEMAKKARKVAIGVKTEIDLDFFTQDEPKDFVVGIENFAKTPRNGQLRWRVEDHNKKKIAGGEKKVELLSQRDNPIELTVPSKRRGCFWLCAEYLENGKILASSEKTYAVGAIRDVEDYPFSSPFGIHSAEPVSWGRFIDGLGMKWVRINPGRYLIEPEKGVLNFKATDQVVDFHASHGREMMFCLFGMPDWAVSDKVKKQVEEGKLKKRAMHDFPPEDWLGHEKYLRKIITRYRDKIAAWEVWNEPNTASWRGTPEEFVKLLEITSRVVRELDPSALVVGPSICKSGWSAWSDEILGLGASEYLDVYTCHYSGGGYGGTPNPEIAPRQAAAMRKMMSLHGKVLPVWDGESGYCSGTRSGENLRPMSKEELERRQENQEEFLSSHARPGPKNTVNANARDELTICDLNTRHMALCLANGIEKTFIHPLGNWTFESEWDNKQYRKQTGIQLPAVGWTTMVERLSWVKFIRRLDLGEENLYGMLFRDEKRDEFLALFWCADGLAEINLTDSGDKVVKLDIFGNPEPMPPLVRGSYRLKLTPTPFYLTKVNEKIKALKSFFTIEGPAFLAENQATPVAIKFKNHLDRKISGTVRLKTSPCLRASPESCRVDLEKQGSLEKEFELTLAPGAERPIALEVQFDCPELELIELKSTRFSRVLPPVSLARRRGEIKIDGKTDDWESEKLKPLLINELEQVVTGIPLCYGDPNTHQADKEWVGPKDLCAEARICYDNDNLYLLVEVEDDRLRVFNRKKAPWVCDGVEVFIDARPAGGQSEPAHTPGVIQIFFNPGDGAKNLETHHAWFGPNDVGHAKWPIKVASRKTDKGYLIEAKIPFAQVIFPNFKATPGRIIGFDICVNDSDIPPKRKSVMVWRGTKNNYKNADKLGKLVIEK